MSDLELLFAVGDDRTAVHLAARADHREHTADGDDLAGRLLKADVILVPRIFVAVDGNGDRFCIVADRTASDGEDEIGLRFPCARDAFRELVRRGIGHDARVLKNLLTALLENGDDLVIDAVLLDRAAAVDEQHVLPVLGEFLLQPL